MLKPSTPGSHPLLRGVWLTAFFLLLAAAGLFALRSTFTPAVALAAAALFVAGLVGYLVRHFRFLRVLDRAERSFGAGDLPAARALAAPLMDRYPAFPAVQRLAGRILYYSGDPLSAATLLEGVARTTPDHEVVTTLVAAYAALNRVGDARRAAQLSPDDPDVLLALAWAELVSLGGDREQGSALLERIDTHVGRRAAMAAALRAVDAAHRADAVEVRRQLALSESYRDVLRFDEEQAFIGYLGGVALRELGSYDDARSTFTRAIAAAPDTIGEALARRERSHIPSGDVPSSSSVQPSSD